MTNINYDNDTFIKKLICPICGHEFTETAVKSNSPRICSKDTDFFIRYKTINPYFYDVWLCPKCGYASMKSEFNNIKSSDKALVLSYVTSKWKTKTYSYFLDVDQAIERYKLALITSLSIKRKLSSPSMICLKLSWMYRLKNDSENELIFLKKSLNGFLQAFSTESFPIFGMNRETLTYLIGELYRRTGDTTNALFWYSKVITTVGTSYRIKEMARTGKRSIK